MNAKTLQVCGTGSGVGKSVIVAGLCRIFLQDGFKVAPFKAQNMSLNSFVTPEGGEIGRAQALQAAACGLNPSVDMNPVLLKPTSDIGSQVIVRGKPLGNMSAVQYADYKKRVKPCVLSSFQRLKREFELIILEGAGSPAEVNLKSHDIVNMNMARAASAPVILVGDIDRGGVFAWLIGTWELLTKEEQSRVKGFVINKFRGDKRILKSGLDFLEKRTGVKVLGVIPYFKDINIPAEDSLCLDIQTSGRGKKSQNAGLIDIAIIKLPHISNFTDFDALENEPDVGLRYVTNTKGLAGADIIIIPGSKNVFFDLKWLKKVGLAEGLQRAMKDKPLTMLIGMCGGYQMLGEKIFDLDGLESRRGKISGLGILPMTTVFKKKKLLAQVRAKEISSGLRVFGYEIHHGRTQIAKSKAMFRIFQRQGKCANSFDGAVSEDDRVWGTYIHGVFDADAFRRELLNRIRIKKGWQPITNFSPLNLDKELDKLALLLRDNLDMQALSKLIFG